MQYDIDQLNKEISVLNQNKEMAFQSYHKICGAIEMLDAMRIQLETDREEKLKKDSEENKLEENLEII